VKERWRRSALAKNRRALLSVGARIFLGGIKIPVLDVKPFALKNNKSHVFF
jgi:hypothetical protein